MKPRDTINRSQRRDQPLFWMLYGFLTAAYLHGVMTNPALAEPWTAVLVGTLFVVHGYLHSRIRHVTTPVQVFANLAVQSLVATGIMLLTREHTIMAGLYFPLIGEALASGVLWVGIAGTVISAVGLFVGQYVLCGWEWFSVGALTFTLPLLFVSGYVFLYQRQDRERQRAQDLLVQLQSAHRQLAAYADQVEVLSISRERQRMARELHDTLAQGLVAVIMQLETTDALLEQARSERAREIIQQTMARARRTLADARQSIQALREASVASDDPVAAIRQAVDDLRRSADIPCTLELPAQPMQLSQATAHHLIRIVQEALANVAKHARARQVGIRLAAAPDHVSLEISDDGIGFDPPAMAEQTGHYGIRGMRERTELAGGQFTLVSHPGQGTTLRVTLPIFEE